MPDVVPNSYVVQTKVTPGNLSGNIIEASLNTMISEIESLIKKTGAKASIVNTMETFGTVVLSCTPAFAQKVQALPSVGVVVANGIVRAPTPPRKPGGPRPS